MVWAKNKLSFLTFLLIYPQPTLFSLFITTETTIRDVFFARLVKHAYSLGHLGGDQWEWRKMITWCFWKPTKWCNFQTVNFVIFYSPPPSLSHTQTHTHTPDRLPSKRRKMCTERSRWPGCRRPHTSWMTSELELKKDNWLRSSQSELLTSDLKQWNNWGLKSGLVVDELDSQRKGRGFESSPSNTRWKWCKSHARIDS